MSISRARVKPPEHQNGSNGHLSRKLRKKSHWWIWACGLAHSLPAAVMEASSYACDQPHHHPYFDPDESMDEGHEEAGEGESSTSHASPRYTVSGAGMKRLLVCVLVDHGGLSIKDACERIGESEHTFHHGHWLAKFRAARKDGKDEIAAVLEEHRGGARAGSIKITPDSKEFLLEAAHNGVPVGEMRDGLRQHYNDQGDSDRSPAGKRAIQKSLHNAGMVYVRDSRPPMIFTPWFARWRRDFVDYWLSEYEKDESIFKRLICSDEKKIALYKEKAGHWIELGEGTSHGVYCPARVFNMSDQEYKDWKAEHKSDTLPAAKSRGLYPLNFSGAVGFNMKSKLFFLEPGKTLTKAVYLEMLRDPLNGLTEMVNRCRAKLHPGGILAKDNDPKHNSSEVDAVLKELGLRSFAAHRYNEDHSYFDTQAGPGGHPKLFEQELLPAYSPDINRPIEKVWRELQTRVFRRVGEITGKKRMKEIVTEEWNSLEFEPTPGWCGINALFLEMPLVLQEIKKQDGFDTHFMH